MPLEEDLNNVVQDLRQRLEHLEKLLGIPATPHTPGFDPLRFQQILTSYLARILVFLFVPLGVIGVLGSVFPGQVSKIEVLGLPLWNLGGEPLAPGLSLGIVAVGGGAIGLISFGGMAIGGLAFGGGALGIVAIGGGAVGVVAVGGGSCGVIALGGGACGYIAIGGGAYGQYVLAGDGKGRYVLDRKRQDDEAVRLFCRYLPRLQEAFVEEMPSTERT
jgi:hypothetical protein